MSSVTWNAADYAKNSHGQLAWALSIIHRLDLPANAAILDIGCGDGKITAELARRVPQGFVMGIDNSPEMIEHACNTWTNEIQNIEFKIADAQSFEPSGNFDFAFSNSTLHWITDHLAVLRNVCKALKPGGRIVFSMGGEGTASTVFCVLHEFRRNGRWANYLSESITPYNFTGPEQYNQWLPEAGLIGTRVALIKKQITYRNLDALEGWLRTTWTPFSRLVPDELRDQFLHELALQVSLNSKTNEEGSILLPMVNLEVEAIKSPV